MAMGRNKKLLVKKRKVLELNESKMMAGRSFKILLALI